MYTYGAAISFFVAYRKRRSRPWRFPSPETSPAAPILAGNLVGNLLGFSAWALFGASFRVVNRKVDRFGVLPPLGCVRVSTLQFLARLIRNR